VCYGTFEHSGDNGGTLWDLRDRTDRILRKILESSNHEEAIGFKSTFLTTRDSIDDYNFDMLRTAYQACMDTDAIAAAGIKPLADLIASIDKIWPLSTDDFNQTMTKADLDGFHQANLFVEQLGVSVFHDHCQGDEGGAIMPDFLDSKHNRVCWTTPNVYYKTNLTVYSDSDAMEQYLHTLSRVFYLAHPNLDESAAAALAESVIRFEIDLIQTASPFVNVTGDLFVSQLDGPTGRISA
jgi:endothelin-converting enzyme